MSILYCVSIVYFIGSVTLIDPDRICAETNGSIYMLPGETITLQCVVDNTGAHVNVLIWNTPVSRIEM